MIRNRASEPKTVTTPPRLAVWLSGLQMIWVGMQLMRKSEIINCADVDAFGRTAQITPRQATWLPRMIATATQRQTTTRSSGDGRRTAMTPVAVSQKTMKRQMYAMTGRTWAAGLSHSAA